MVHQPAAERAIARVDANREQLIADTAACVRIPSVTGNEGPVQAFMRSLFETLPLRIDQFEGGETDASSHPAFVPVAWSTAGRPNVVGTLPAGGEGGHSLALAGHVDVVSPEPVDLWTQDPWGGALVTVDGEQRLYGRGALDMKSGTVACFHALKAVLDAGLRPRGQVALQSVVEEEAGGGAGLLATLARGHTAEALLNPEPFHRALILGQPGVMLFRVTVHGKTAHAANSQHGVNAIGKMLPLYEAMVELDAVRAARWLDPFFGPQGRAVNLNVGCFHSGDWPSTVAGRAVMECRVAFIPPQTMAEVRAEVETRIAEAAQSDPWLREHPPVVEWFGWQADPWRQDADHPFIHTLSDTVRQVTGITPPIQACTAGLDTRFAGPFGMAAACVGARGDAMHGADEYVEVESVVETTRILAATIVSWCGVME